MYGDRVFQEVAGGLFLAAIVLHAAGVVAGIVRGRGPRAGIPVSLGLTALGAGAVCSLTGIVVRLLGTGNIPIHSRYETHVAMGFTAALFWLIIAALQRPWRYRSAAASVWNLLAAIAAGVPFVFGRILAFRADYDVMLKPPALQTAWFPPHVTAYMLGYGFLFMTWVVGTVYLVSRLFTKSPKVPSGDGPVLDLDRLTYVCASIAFPLLTLGVSLGCIWGQVAWGNWWGWDIKETWALVSWLTMLLYFHVRFALGMSGIPSALVIFLAGPVVMITYLGVSFLPAALKSLHVYQ